MARRKTKQVRYVPKGPFVVRIKGVPYHYNPDHVDQKTGWPGYESLPDAMEPQHKASFRTIEVDAPVEQATAGPGELRRQVRKAKAEDDGPETVEEPNSDNDDGDGDDA